MNPNLAHQLSGLIKSLSGAQGSVVSTDRAAADRQQIECRKFATGWQAAGLTSVISKVSRDSCSHHRTQTCERQRLMDQSPSSLRASTRTRPSLSQHQERPTMFSHSRSSQHPEGRLYQVDTAHDSCGPNGAEDKVASSLIRTAWDEIVLPIVNPPP